MFPLMLSFGIEAGAIGALLLKQALALAVERKIIGARRERGGQRSSACGCAQGSISERLGQLQRRARTHAEVARQHQQRLLVLVLGLQQRLLVVGKLHLGAQHVHARRRSRVMFVLGQLEQRAGIRHARLRGIDARLRRLCVQIEAGNHAHDQVARVRSSILPASSDRSLAFSAR